jgi:PBP1b-binding outer membrane lipoprotein LpoB
MKKNIFITLALLVVLVFLSCSEKEPIPPKAPVKEKVEIRITDVKKSSVPADFVPEHLKHSKIEVVKHY